MAAPASEPPPVAPPDSMVADGIPPVPASVAAALGPYTEFRGAAFLSWRPDGRDMLIATRFGDTTQLHRVAAARGARTQLTFFPDRVSSAAYTRAPTAGEPLLVFSKDTGGNEFTQSYRLDNGGARVTLLTDGRSRNSLGVFSATRQAARVHLHAPHRRRQRPLRRRRRRSQRPTACSRRSRAVAGRCSTGRPGDDQLLVRETSRSTRATCGSFDAASGEAHAADHPQGDRRDKVATSGGAFVSDGRVHLTRHRQGQRCSAPGARRAGRAGGTSS